MDYCCEFQSISRVLCDFENLFGGLSTLSNMASTGWFNQTMEQIGFFDRKTVSTLNRVVCVCVCARETKAHLGKHVILNAISMNSLTGVAYGDRHDLHVVLLPQVFRPPPRRNKTALIRFRCVRFHVCKHDRSHAPSCVRGRPLVVWTSPAGHHWSQGIDPTTLIRKHSGRKSGYFT